MSKVHLVRGAGLIARIAGHDLLDQDEHDALISHGTSLDTNDSIIDRSYLIGLGSHDATDEELEHKLELRSNAANLIRNVVKTTYGNPGLELALRHRLRRIAVSETVAALNLGRAHGIKRRSGPTTKVAKQVRGGSCSLCTSLHQTPDGMPRIYQLDQLPIRSPRGVAIGPAHPGCLCELYEVTADHGSPLMRSQINVVGQTAGRNFHVGSFGLGPALISGTPAQTIPPIVNENMREALELSADANPAPDDLPIRLNPTVEWLHQQVELQTLLPEYQEGLQDQAMGLDTFPQESVKDSMRDKIDRDLKANQAVALLSRVALRSEH